MLCSFVKEVFDYISLIRIYLAPILPKDVPHLHLIEKQIIYDVQPEENDRGKISKPAQSVQIRNLGATEWKQYSANKLM